jgi:Oxidoreductase family, NAD-binding Rossmann fold
MATDTLRIGIIGAGANTRSRHIPGLRMQNSVEIVGVANRSVASSQKAAKELDIPKAYGDWECNQLLLSFTDGFQQSNRMHTASMVLSAIISDPAWRRSPLRGGGRPRWCAAGSPPFCQPQPSA